MHRYREPRPLPSDPATKPPGPHLCSAPFAAEGGLAGITHVLAIDGGGTGTRAELRSLDGTLLGRAETGPGNLFQNRAGALAATLAAWQASCAAAGIAPDLLAPTTCLSAGYAGLSAPGAEADLRAACAAFSSVKLSSDAYTALIGAFEGGPGALMVIGTGTAGCVLDAAGKVRQCGGWGFPAGDGGSGAWMGLQLVGAWLDWRDGIGEESLLWAPLSAALPADRAESSPGCGPRVRRSMRPLRDTSPGPPLRATAWPCGSPRLPPPIFSGSRAD